ncbi:MAG: four helix bundle protein [Candidatus Paceibacterota bacterium]
MLHEYIRKDRSLFSDFLPPSLRVATNKSISFCPLRLCEALRSNPSFFLLSSLSPTKQFSIFNLKKFVAIYDTLPVYKVSYDFLLDLFKFTKNFDREYKYTIGEDLKKETTQMIANIYRANSSQSKWALLQSARENLEVVRLYLRLIKDLKQINLDKFIALNEKIESVSKQLCAWQSSSK